MMLPHHSLTHTQHAHMIHTHIPASAATPYTQLAYYYLIASSTIVYNPLCTSYTETTVSRIVYIDYSSRAIH